MTAKFVPTMDQREIVVRMLADGATRAQMTAALGLTRGSSAFPRAFRAELAAARPEPVPCVVCGHINPTRQNQLGQSPAQTCGRVCEMERNRQLRRQFRCEHREELRQAYFTRPDRYERLEIERERGRKRWRELKAIEIAFVELALVPDAKARNRTLRKEGMLCNTRTRRVALERVLHQIQAEEEKFK